MAITGHTVTAAGGAGGTDLKPLAAQIGRGPGTFDYGGEKYVGGGDQKTTGAGGVAPGGAGNGGNAFGLQGGGAGAPGAGWVRFRPAADTGGVPELDTTPPTAPTLTITASTLSSLTVTATGATD